MTERQVIYLPGYKFYQEFRSCNKDACSSCRNGPGHGPYWFRRDQLTGQVKYIGKELPDDVNQANYWYQQQLEWSEKELEELRKRVRALERYVNQRPLQSGDIDLLHSRIGIMGIYEPMAWKKVKPSGEWSCTRCPAWHAPGSGWGAYRNEKGELVCEKCFGKAKVGAVENA